MKTKAEMSLKKAEAEDFDRVYDELERSFIPDERRDREEARELVERGAYTVWHVLDGENRVGFVTVWQLSFGAFVEHFATYPQYRNKGYGGAALALLKERYGSIVLEAEPPTGELPARRVAFYRRNGFFKNEQYYFQPPFRKDGNGVELVLMSWPSPISDFKDTVSEIYGRVYGREYKSL